MCKEITLIIEWLHDPNCETENVWLEIKSYDYDWIIIFVVNCVGSAWGSLEPAKSDKTNNITVSGMVLGNAGRVARW